MEVRLSFCRRTHSHQGDKLIKLFTPVGLVEGAWQLFNLLTLRSRVIRQRLTPEADQELIADFFAHVIFSGCRDFQCDSDCE